MGLKLMVNSVLACCSKIVCCLLIHISVLKFTATLLLPGKNVLFVYRLNQMISKVIFPEL